MSDFTTELRYLVEANKVNVDPDYPIGLDQYPIFDEAYRPILNGLIINHFYFHEICYDSSERFIFEINNVMREIMPYYNQLYTSELLSYDPFVEYSKELSQINNQTENVIDKVVEIIDGLKTLNSESNTEGFSRQTDNTKGTSKVTDDERIASENERNEDGRSVGSDTPRDLLNIGTIESNVYASAATISDNDSREQGTSNRNAETASENESDSLTTTSDDSKIKVSNSNDELTEKNKDTDSKKETNGNMSTFESGHQRSKTELIVELRDSFINVDQMVLNDLNLNECFMMVYGND